MEIKVQMKPVMNHGKDGVLLIELTELTGTVPVSTLSGKNFEIRKNVTKFAA